MMMRTYILPGVEPQREKRSLVDDGPKHDGHQRRKSDDAGVEHRVRGLQPAWPSLELEIPPECTRGALPLREVVC